MKKLKIGIAGLGRIGKIHLNNLLELNNVEVIAVMDPSFEALKYAIGKGVELGLQNYKELRRDKSSLKHIVICTPTNTHADYVEIAAKSGKHIFCEKPLDLNLQRINDVLKVVEKSKIKLMIGFQ